jgi:hypothetical protein
LYLLHNISSAALPASAQNAAAHQQLVVNVPLTCLILRWSSCIAQVKQL